MRQHFVAPKVWKKNSLRSSNLISMLFALLISFNLFLNLSFTLQALIRYILNCFTIVWQLEFYVMSASSLFFNDLFIQLSFLSQ